MCAALLALLLLTSYQAATLDRITGGFTVIFHSHGAVAPLALSSHPEPEQMQFMAYLTRSEVEAFTPQFDAPIAWMAQVFAAEVMPRHSTNYIARCITSRVDADIVPAQMLRPDVSTYLIAPPEAHSSQYIFHGYHPGYLESLLLQRASSRAAVKAPRLRNETAAPSAYHPSPGVFHRPHPTSTPSRANSASPTRTLSSRAASPSPTRRATPQQAPPTPATLERSMRSIHIASNVKNHEETTITIRGRAANVAHHAGTLVPLQPRSQPQRRPSDRPLHLQGSLGVSTSSSASSTTSFNWENDAESVLLESVIAAAERDGMC